MPISRRDVNLQEILRGVADVQKKLAIGNRVHLYEECRKPGNLFDSQRLLRQTGSIPAFFIGKASILWLLLGCSVRLRHELDRDKTCRK